MGGRTKTSTRTPGPLGSGAVLLAELNATSEAVRDERARTAKIERLAELRSPLLARFRPVDVRGPVWLFDFVGHLRQSRGDRVFVQGFTRGDEADAESFRIRIEAARLLRVALEVDDRRVDHRRRSPRLHQGDSAATARR